MSIERHFFLKKLQIDLNLCVAASSNIVYMLMDDQTPHQIPTVDLLVDNNRKKVAIKVKIGLTMTCHIWYNIL